MLSNFQIADIAKDLHINLSLNNILMKNELKKPIDGNYIINLESNDQGNGTHWTALIIKNKQAFYFDSFGVLPSVEVINFCKKRHGLHLHYNNWIIQDYHSDLCGWYCLGLLLFNKLHRKKYTKLSQCCNDFINYFQDETKLNGNILKQFFNPHIFRFKSILLNNE